jgi:hypothetical protein
MVSKQRLMILSAEEFLPFPAPIPCRAASCVFARSDSPPCGAATFVPLPVCTSGLAGRLCVRRIDTTAMLRSDSILANAQSFVTPVRGTAQAASLRHTEGSSATLARKIEEIFRSKPVLATCAAASRWRRVGRPLQGCLQSVEPLFSVNAPFCPPAMKLFADLPDPSRPPYLWPVRPLQQNRRIPFQQLFCQPAMETMRTAAQRELRIPVRPPAGVAE